MDSEPVINFEKHIEAKRIGVLLEKNKEFLGNFDLITVGEMGYILQSKQEKTLASRDWVLFDYDDTLVATTQIKEKRLTLYNTYLQNLGISATEDQVAKIVEVTDDFSRWEEKEDEGKHYHANAHMASLQWVTNILKDSNGRIDEAIVDFQINLERVKTQLTKDQPSEEADHFYFRLTDKKFILRGIDKMWGSAIEDIFVQTMFNPPQYSETIDVAKEIGPDKSSDWVNIGIFTYGDPYYQLLKVFELMKQHADFPISQIWLTRGPKGDFIIEVMKTKMINSSDGSKQVAVMIDDNPKELSSILSVNDQLEKNANLSFVAVRSKRSGTKEQESDWEVNTRGSELDFTAHSFLPGDISKILKLTRGLK